MRSILKKVGCMLVIIGVCTFLTACGENGAEERVKTGEERASELKEDAKEAVDQLNEGVQKLEQDGNAVEEG